LDSEQDFLKILPQIGENIVCLDLDAKWFWKRYFEIDFYHQKIPYEIKYQEKPEIKNSIRAAKELKVKQLIIITKDLEKKEKIQNIDVSFVPLWKWLLK
jgi:predicted AAA+ superfamily ATPase